jgi:hypothetical protein
MIVNVRRRTLHTGAAIGLLLACVASPATAGPATPQQSAEAGRHCHTVQLPTLGFGNAALHGGDPTGRYLVGQEWTFVDGIFASKMLVWVDRQVRELNTESLQPYVFVRATDVNRHGVIVGARMTNPNTFHEDAWLYRDGRFTFLPGLRPTDSTAAVAINARGDVIGSSNDPIGESSHVVMWPADRPGTVVEWTVPNQPRFGNIPVDIDDDGTMIGWFGGRPGQTNYIRRPDGTTYQLTAPPGVENIEASAVRNGWIVGHGQIGIQGVGLRWNLRTGGVETIFTEYSWFAAVNRHGTIGAFGAIIHRNGETVPIAVYDTPLVLTDNGTAAGMTGSPVLWIGC